MYMVSVSSSRIDSVGYDEHLKLLQIQFVNGAMYEYYDVPKDIYIGLITASSAGEYFHEYVRNVYRFSKIWLILINEY